MLHVEHPQSINNNGNKRRPSLQTEPTATAATAATAPPAPHRSTHPARDRASERASRGEGESVCQRRRRNYIVNDFIIYLAN